MCYMCIIIAVVAIMSIIVMVDVYTYVHMYLCMPMHCSSLEEWLCCRVVRGGQIKKTDQYTLIEQSPLFKHSNKTVSLY